MPRGRKPIYGPGNHLGIAEFKRHRRAARMAVAKGQSIVRVLPSLGVIPQVSINTMKYSESFSITNTLGVYNSYIYNLNSIFDPNRTGTGHQPYGHDTLATLYNRYLVTKCKWLIECQITSANDTQSGVAPVNSANDPGFPTLYEVPHSVQQVLPRDLRIIKYKGSSNLAKLSSYGAKYNAADQYSASYNSSPTELMTLVIGQNNRDGTTVTGTYYITLWYTVKSYDPKELAGS